MLSRVINEFRALGENLLNGGELFLWICLVFIIGMIMDGHVAGNDAVRVIPVRLEVFIELDLAGAMDLPTFLTIMIMISSMVRAMADLTMAASNTAFFG